MTSFTTLEILKIAIANEKKENAYYSTVSQLSEIQEVRDLFAEMAGEEDMHKEYLTTALEMYRETGKIPDMKFGNDAEESIRDVLASTAVMERIASSRFDSIALISAMQNEKEAIKMYKEHAKESVDPEEKKLFKWLAKWEEMHHKSLFQLGREIKGIQDIL